jgi:hypothetical protein
MVRKHVIELLAFSAFRILHRFGDSSLLLRRNVTDSVQNWSAVPLMFLDAIIIP